MNNRLLGMLALIGAPLLLIGHTVENIYPSLAGSWFYGVYGFIYISGWMCSIEVLRRAEATGRSLFGKSLLWILLCTLFLANLSNVFAILSPKNTSTLMITLDSFWPISNLIMLVVGITVLLANRISGWQRFVPLFAGLWFPFAMSTKTLLSGVPMPGNVVMLYSALAWSLLAVVAMTYKKTQTQETTKNFQML